MYVACSTRFRIKDKNNKKILMSSQEVVQIEEEKRKNLNIVFIGHVDAGKSTISGHLVSDLGKLDKRQLEKLEQQAKALNRESWKYAFAMDTSEEERERGKTVECARESFVTPNGRRIIIIDAPGHKGFVHNMISGAAQADTAILVISARKGEFESGFEKGGQTSEHALLAYVNGIKQIVCLINKMDDVTVEYSRERYDSIVSQMKLYLESVGYASKNIFFLPISGFTGENLVSTKELNPKLSEWYKGPSFLELLDDLKVPKRDTKSPLCACVSGHYKENNAFIVVKVEQGKMCIGDTVLCLPENQTFDILDIEAEQEEGLKLTQAKAGDNVRVRVKDDIWDFLTEGSVICAQPSPDQPQTVFVTNRFQVNLLIVSTAENLVITSGYSCVAHINLQQVGCQIRAILADLDLKTGKVKPEYIVSTEPLKVHRPTHVLSKSRIICEIITQRPICIQNYAGHEALGRVILRHESDTVAIGYIINAKPAK